jgi:hypothetical protein
VNSGHPLIVLVADDGLSFKFCHKKAPEGGSVPTWVILTPEPVPPISGMDMRTGAQIGFFGPTNPTNLEGAVQSNFCMGVSDRITRPTFGPLSCACQQHVADMSPTADNAGKILPTGRCCDTDIFFAVPVQKNVRKCRHFINMQ